jgi:hypothetical protein
VLNRFLWWKCLDCLNWNKCFFGVQSVDTVGRCTTSYLLAGTVCLWHLVYLPFCYLAHETRTINSGGLLIVNHLGQSLSTRQPSVRSNLLYSFRRLLLSTASTITMSQTIFMTQAGIDILTWFRYGKSPLFGWGKGRPLVTKMSQFSVIDHTYQKPLPKMGSSYNKVLQPFFNASKAQAWLNLRLFSSIYDCS